MSGRKPKVYKDNKQIQRSDTLLSKSLATTLIQMVLRGESLFPHRRTGKEYLELDIGEEKPVILRLSTLNQWIARNNVVPETGKTLRELLNIARREYRNSVWEERREALIEDSENKLHRIVKMRTKVPVRNMFGVHVKNEDGSLAYRENSELLGHQAKVAMYLTERLAPEKYGRVDRTVNKHLVFSLADLRKAEEDMTRGESQPT